MCNLETSWMNKNLKFSKINLVLDTLKEAQKDGLILVNKDSLKVPEKAKPFIRNICMAFDLRLHESKPETQVFSMTI
jgi:oxygen-independent coproporphyrinogen-3 oxidase